MKASDASPQILGRFPSPGSPNFLDKNGRCSMQGWSSERVPLTVSSSYKRRQTSLSSLMPHHSGRTVPSKWEDAERWITSPSSNAFLNNRRPMSRSGPIGQSKTAYYSNYSPNSQGFQSGKTGYSLALHQSPISSGQMLEATTHSKTTNESAGVSGFSDMPSESSSAESSQDARLEQYVDGNGEVSRRDMATQMSRASSSDSSSSKGWPQSAAHPTKEAHFDLSGKRLEEKDVQVDKWATVLRWPKRNGAKQAKRDPPEVVEMYKTAVAEAEARCPTQAPASPWDVAALAKKHGDELWVTLTYNSSPRNQPYAAGFNFIHPNNQIKYEREEAKISAWQNLQKAKSEAAVRKLEMNLERKRSKSMDKIIKKFNKAEKKSQKMKKQLAEEKARSAHRDEESKRSARVSPYPVSIHVGSFSCCFTGHGL